MDVKKFYEADRKEVFNAQHTIMGVLSRSTETAERADRELNMEDINALGRILAFELKNEHEALNAYEHVVDYLWMSYRITFRQKEKLRSPSGPVCTKASVVW